MYILSGKGVKSRDYLSYFPTSIAEMIEKSPNENLCEIRLRPARPIILYYGRDAYFISENSGLTNNQENAFILTKTDFIRICELVVEFSVYAHEGELRNGFVTVKGGHRIGFAGNVTFGSIRNVHDITSINFRIAHEHIGIGNSVINNIITDNNIKNTIILSPPMCGKTSLLRDLVRIISELGYKTGVCDTRGEIAAVYDGQPYMNIGDADVITGADKVFGMTMLLRCMSPDVIVCDELGSKEDADTVSSILSSGVSVIASVHAEDFEELKSKRVFKELCEKFECFITLSGIGNVCEVCYG